MISRNYEPLLIASSARDGEGGLEVVATRSQDGKTVVLQAVNLSDQPRPAAIDLGHFLGPRSLVKFEQLTGPLDAVNTFDCPDNIKATGGQGRLELIDGRAWHTFAPHSFTVLRLE